MAEATRAPSNARRGRARHNGMSNFREKFDFQATALRIPSRGVVGTLIDVDFISPTNPTNSRQVIMTCVRLIAESTKEDETTQLCSYLMSIVTSVFRNVENDALEALRQLGGKTTTRMLPRDSGATAIVLEPVADPGICLLIFAQAVIVMFKDISTYGYESSIRDRINAMRAMVDIDPGVTELRAFDYDKANILRTRVGSCDPFRVAVVNAILSQARNSDHLGKICSYLTTILAWTDMSSLKFIADSLLSNKSPVLYDARVTNEIRALADAFYEINKFAYPQFYCIMKSPLECQKLRRNRFPILFAVAAKIRSQTHPSVQQFVVTPQDANTVNDLVALHQGARLRTFNAVT